MDEMTEERDELIRLQQRIKSDDNRFNQRELDLERRGNELALLRESLSRKEDDITASERRFKVSKLGLSVTAAYVLC